MKYISTRGAAPPITFREAVLTGLAPDGGLYVPEQWPMFDAEALGAMRRLSFAELAAQALGPYAAGALSPAELADLTDAAFATFDHPETTPISRLPGDGDAYLLELFHGPTLAFKDVAMQLLARLYDWALAGTDRTKTILCATSGDTGGAAVAAFAGAAATRLYVLHPKGRISDVQRRIMTTETADNIVNIAVDGSFDDCQRIVKALFADAEFAAAHDLGGVNSINWVRLAIQTVYYFYAAFRVDGPASFVAPTGNFGDVFAGYAAKRAGLAMGPLGVAVNENDILFRALERGDYSRAAVVRTTSPSMDIQVASNFERLLYEAGGRDAAATRDLMAAFTSDGAVAIPAATLEAIRRDFAAARADEAETAAKIAALAEAGLIVDPHTAVGLVAADELRALGRIDAPIVVLATAHAAKFPEAVAAACGRRPEPPARFADLFDRPERMIDCAAEPHAVAAIIAAG